MGDLSFLPQTPATVEAIYAWWKRRGEAEGPRNYLGASIIGHECDRFLWYAFRQCVKESLEGRKYRLFNTGHREEERFVMELRGIGCTVHDRDPENVTQQIGVSAVGGHFKGHLDAVIQGVPEAPKTWHVGEFKTHNDKSFTALEKVGVKAAKPLHHAQMQVYMGLVGMERTLYLACNKDTDALYSERIDYSAQECKAILARAERIIRSIQPPERITQRADDYRCKQCSAAALCFGMAPVAIPLPAKTCRTCCHATPELDGDGRWSCKRKAEMAPCGDHLLIPGLILFATPTDAGESWIEFKNADGSVWRHGDGTDGTWSTEELMRSPVPAIGKKEATLVKKAFNGKVVEIEGECLFEGTTDQGKEIDFALRKALCLKADEPIPDPINSTEDGDHTVYEYDLSVLVVIYKNGNVKVSGLPF